jgi:hypothetical protein
MRLEWIAAGTLVGMLAAGCGGKVNGPGDNGSGDDGGGEDAGTPEPLPADASPPPPQRDAGATSFDMGQVQQAQAQCGLSHGAEDPVSTWGNAQAELVGAWYLCSGSTALSATTFSPGIELATDGTWYRLASDGQGGLTRGQGVENQGTWFVGCEAESPFPQNQTCPGQGSPIDFSDSSAATQDGDSGPLSFESGPRRVHILDYLGSSGATADVWLVPLQ